MVTESTTITKNSIDSSHISKDKVSLFNSLMIIFKPLMHLLTVAISLNLKIFLKSNVDLKIRGTKKICIIKCFCGMEVD